MAPECIHCDSLAELVTGEAVYPHRPDLFHKSFWVCWPCHSNCGCHPGTKIALGTPANATLRKARSAAHAAFDAWWKEYDTGDTKDARWHGYRWLARAMGITDDECHIGMMNLGECEQVVMTIEQYRRIRK